MVDKEDHHPMCNVVCTPTSKAVCDCLKMDEVDNSRVDTTRYGKPRPGWQPLDNQKMLNELAELQKQITWLGEWMENHLNLSAVAPSPANIVGRAIEVMDGFRRATAAALPHLESYLKQIARTSEGVDPR